MFSEADNSLLPDVFEVLLDAHRIAESVPPVHPVDLFARIPVAFIAEREIYLRVVLRACAIFEQICAPPVSRAATNARASLEIVDLSEIATTNRTVHTAWRDQVF